MKKILLTLLIANVVVALDNPANAESIETLPTVAVLTKEEIEVKFNLPPEPDPESKQCNN